MNIQGQIKEIITPKKFILNGIYFGPKKPENIYIYVHGLGSNLFNQKDLIEKIVSKKNAVLAFNNRGSGVITRVKQMDKKELKSYKTHTIGMAHEVFVDSVDDIDGAIDNVKNLGAKNIYLIGHSTGCQKSVYYLAKKAKNKIKGVVLLAPISDFADAYKFTDKKVHAKAVSHARKLVVDGKAHELMPNNIWPYTVDAQRFLSLHTSDSIEEIFSYASNREPKILKKVKQPILIILAEDDEYQDRPITEIADWFRNNRPSDEVIVVKNSPHSFKGGVNKVAKVIEKWSASK